MGAQIWDKQVKIGSKVRFFAIFSSFVHLLSFKFHRMIAWNNVQLLAKIKPTKKSLGAHIWGKCVKIELKIRFFVILSSWVH